MSKTRLIKGPENAIKKLEAFDKKLRGDDSVRVGLPKGSNNYPDGTSVIMVGAVHEFGSPKRNIPQRSFLRTTLVENRRKYKRIFRKAALGLISGNFSREQALGLIGTQVVSDVQNTIRLGISPSLKSREGTALWDTGHLIESITYEVR